MSEKLTPVQKKAAFSGDGPFILRAGAGTGKTSVLINKYLHIYSDIYKKEKDGKKACGQILTVTFTKRAAKEMLDRLRNKIDENSLRYAHISTIDSFCSRFLKENAYAAGLDSDIEVMDEIEAKLFFMKMGLKVLDEEIDFRVKSELSREKFLNESYSLINSLKQQLVSPGEFLKSCKDSEILTVCRAVYLLYLRYEQLLQEENFMDFGKLLFTAYTILNSNSAIRKKIREKFKYVMVDEYQDTNPAQVKLLKLIAGPRNNFFAVGDEQQSIYAFRGAEPGYIINQYRALSGDRKATLEDNFRCFNPIPRLVNAIFNKRVKDYHGIKCARKGGKAKAEVLVAESREKEAEFLAGRVRSFLDSGYRPGQIAILFRGVKNCAAYEDALREAGVKTVTVGGTGFYLQPEIKDLISMLVCIDNPHSERELVRVMRMPPFAFSDSELAGLCSKKQKGDLLYDMVIEGSGKKIADLKNFIEKFRLLKKELPLSSLIERVISESGLIYRAAASAGGENSRKISNINKFISQARHFQSRNIFSTLADFTDYLRQIKEAEIVEPQARPRARGVVHLMSIHQSKGLEFPVVFMPNIAPQNFPGRINPDFFHYRPEKGLVVKDNSKHSDYSMHIKPEIVSKHNREEERLLYVGMTRAEKHLIISGHQNSRGKISRFLNYFVSENEKGDYTIRKEIEDFISFVRPEDFIPSPPEKVEKSFSKEERKKFLKAARALGIPKFHKKREVPSEFSVTQLQVYSQCPRQYNLIYRLGLPRPPAEKSFSASLFGSTFHRMLEEYYKYGGLDSYESMKEKITSLIISSGIGSSEYIKTYQKITEETLSALLDSDMLKPSRKVLFTEKAFVLKVRDAYIKGTIDRVDGPPRRAELIDYKTSFSLDTEKYRIQTGIYALALKKVFNLNPAKANIYFVRRGQIRPVSIMNHPELRIKSLISGIRARKFYPLKGDHCKYCNLCSENI